MRPRPAGPRDARPRCRMRSAVAPSAPCRDAEEARRRDRLLERVILNSYSRDHEARRTILLRRWRTAS